MIRSKYKIKSYTSPSPKLRASRRWNGLNVGLLGGSFNPPHSGHMHIAQSALRKYNFHAIWWMVSPQNPLKSKKDNFQNRYSMTKRYIATQPKMLATDIETQMGIRYSFQTVEKLQKYFPKTCFTWIAGMDNARIFHRWDKWKMLLKKIPFIFFNRPPNKMAMNNNAIRMVKGDKDVTWCLHGKTRNISSTRLRKNRIAHFLKSRV